MESNALPALYKTADALSLNRQRAFFWALRGHLAFLIAAAALSVANIPHWGAALLQALVLVGALCTAAYLMIKRPERIWYAARAVAESVKTLTWRFAMRAEPFDKPDDIARALFASKLRDVTSQNVEIASRLSAHGRNITQEMLAARALSLVDRKVRYESFRIDEQLQWYSSKARLAERDSRVYFGIVVTLNSVALFFALLRIKFPDADNWPTDLFLTLSASVVSWIQAKRFSELAASYNLAANEISLIRDGAAMPSSEPSFSIFVSDAENAFSREHTQWVARKDH